MQKSVVLVLSHDEERLEAFQTLLARFGYTVLTRETTREALIRLSDHTAPVRLIIVDEHWCGSSDDEWGGYEFLQRASNAGIQLPSIVVQTGQFRSRETILQVLRSRGFEAASQAVLLRLPIETIHLLHIIDGLIAPVRSHHTPSAATETPVPL